jgi:MFS family permease
MDHIPVGEIGSQLPMFIDPTMIVDNVLAGYWDAADALGNSPYVGDPEGLWERKRDGAAHGRRNRALGYWGAVGSAGAIVGQLLGGVLTTAFGWRAIFLIKSPSASSRSPRLRATSPTAAVRHSHVSTSEAPRCSPPGWLR